jgi:hypothetical protein
MSLSRPVFHDTPPDRPAVARHVGGPPHTVTGVVRGRDTPIFFLEFAWCRTTRLAERGIVRLRAMREPLGGELLARSSWMRSCGR